MSTPFHPQRTWIERTAVRLGWISNTDANTPPMYGVARTASGASTRLGTSGGRGVALPIADQRLGEAGCSTGALAKYPSPDTWDDVVEYDAAQWPSRAVARHYRLVPTVCFNCESACGLLAYVDKESNSIRKLEGNPLHPGSRGRNCAKGPATINQVNDPDRILYPMKRAGARGEGKWTRVTWDEVLADVGGRIRKALQEKRNNEVVYHVGRPGAEGFMDRVLRAWGVDGHNSHTNICSAGARLGYAIWSGYDRPSPDYANARFILALNAHFESGHYFNPHAQRIREGMSKGAKLAVVDPRLSNTASAADYWLPTIPGTEAALLLAIANVILNDELYDKAFIERWVNWRESLAAMRPGGGDDVTVDDFLDALMQQYADFTPEFAEKECGIPAGTIIEIAQAIGAAGSRFTSHTWRGAASAHLGGWQVSRCLFLLHVLTGSVGTEGGCSPSAWNKYKAHLINPPPPTNQWNEMHWPREYPLTHYELSQLLPYFLKEGRGRLDVYFTRVFNPVWTYPDGFSWIEALSDESMIGLHIALTPTWNETAFFADYVLPMGHGPERHDLTTYETHNGTWIAFRQPVLRQSMTADGSSVRDSRDANPGEVWEEDEFWIALTWAIDPDGAMGIRKYFESQEQPGEMLTVDEYYRYIFDHVPGLKERASKEGLTPIDWMRKHGAFEVSRKDYDKHEKPVGKAALDGSQVDGATGVVKKNGVAVGVKIGDGVVHGFPTPSRKLEFYNATLAEWGWPEYVMPGYIKTHIRGGDDAQKSINAGNDHLDFCLLPTFRLPTLIHTRSGSAKWLNEISQRNPVWLHTSDAKRFGIRNGDLVRVTTEIGHFVDRVWVTEGVRPGVVACSHHLGRWRRRQDPDNSRWSGSLVEMDAGSPGKWRMRTLQGPQPFDSNDADSRRIWWREGGVAQNLTHAVHPDPISGMHCWHQRAKVEAAHPGDQCGDVFVDTEKSMDVYRRWLELTRADRAPAGLRRPLWFNRPLRPKDEAYRV